MKVSAWILSSAKRDYKISDIVHKWVPVALSVVVWGVAVEVLVQKNVFFCKQAGAELCQAQVNFSWLVW